MSAALSIANKVMQNLTTEYTELDEGTEGMRKKIARQSVIVLSVPKRTGEPVARPFPENSDALLTGAPKSQSRRALPPPMSMGGPSGLRGGGGARGMRWGLGLTPTHPARRR